MKVNNPHSVMAALQTRKKDVIRVCTSQDTSSGSDGWAEVVDLARKSGVKLEAGARGGAGPRVEGGRTSTHFAEIRERAALSIGELFDRAPGIFLALDMIQDPHNLGAIFRTAAFFDVKGIILTENRSSPLSETVYNVASGGVEYVPFAMVANLNTAYDLAKEKDLWIVGTSEHSEESIFDLPHDRSWLVVVGNEEKGVRKNLLEKCDYQVAIPSHGQLKSLNVSIATSVILTALTSKKS